jgi:hypothetical protein
MRSSSSCASSWRRSRTRSRSAASMRRSASWRVHGRASARCASATANRGAARWRRSARYKIISSSGCATSCAVRRGPSRSTRHVATETPNRLLCARPRYRAGPIPCMPLPHANRAPTEPPAMPPAAAYRARRVPCLGSCRRRLSRRRWGCSAGWGATNLHYKSGSH